MPGAVAVIVKSARGLPIMDRRSELTDAFVEIRFAGEVKKTPVCHRSLNPAWGDPPGSGMEFSFNFSEDEQLYDELLLLRVMDHDTYSAHDAIGRVDIDLSMFLFASSTPKEICGFFPIFDTMHGIRGELELEINVNLIPTTNSTTDVVFFASTSVPPNFKLVTLFGLVDELVVNEDPEFQLIDKLRTSRTSNEVRVKVFSQLSAQVRRKLAMKSLDLGANAVLGYQQFFDIEGDTGVVVRGFGTAVFMIPAESPGLKSAEMILSLSSSQQSAQSAFSGSSLNPLNHQISMSGVSPDPNAGATLEDCFPSKFDGRIYKHVVEYPFFTLKTFEHGGSSGAADPTSFITALGGLVCARSVKLLDRMEDPEKSLMRDNWWLELRNEIKSHMEAFSCNCVVGYCEFTTMYEDLMVLSAIGTAANLDPLFMPQRSNLGYSSLSIDHPSESSEQMSPRSPIQYSGGGTSPGDASGSGPGNPFGFSCNVQSSNSKCALLHLPYNDASLPFSSDTPVCCMCKSAKVHDVLLSTCEPPPPCDVIVSGPPIVLHANVVKKKKRGHGEAEAIELSGLLSFLEHEVQQQLLNKLQLSHMNSCWGLQITITVTENAVIGLAVGTGLHLAALPFPQLVDLPQKYEAGIDGSLRSDILNTRKELSDKHSNSLTDCSSTEANKEAIEQLQESLPNLDLSVDGKQVHAYVVKPLEDSLLLSSYKSTLKSLNTKSSTLSSCHGVLGSGKDDSSLSLTNQNRVFNNLAIQVSHCDSYRNTTWNSTAFAQTLDSALAKLNYKARRNNTDSVLMNVRMQLSGSDNVDDSAILCCTADICEPIVEDLDSVILSRSPIQISSLTQLPNFCVEKYMGYINTFFIRETTDLRLFSSTAGFVSCCLAEILTVLKARISNMGANALLSFRILYFDVYDNWHKNQAQTLLNVRGDIVKLLPGATGTGGGTSGSRGTLQNFNLASE